MVRRRSDSYADDVAIRARQQAAVAELGRRALAGAPLDELIEAAAEQAARELDGDYVSVLELTGDRRGMLIRGGHGFPEGVLGGVLPANPEDLPGFVLHGDGPVLIDDFATEGRLGPSPLQRDLQVVSALAAPVGAPGRRFGVMVAHSRAPRHFDPDDAHFLQSVANLLGAAAERARHEEIVSDSEARFRDLVDTTRPPLGVPLRVPVDAPRRGTPLGARGGRPALAAGEFAGYAGTAIDIHERRTTGGGELPAQ